MCGGGLQGTGAPLLHHPLGQLTIQVSRDAGIRHDHDTLRIGDKEVEDRGDLSSRNTPKEFVIRVFRGRYLQRARLFNELAVIWLSSLENKMPERWKSLG